MVTTIDSIDNFRRHPKFTSLPVPAKDNSNSDQLLIQLQVNEDYNSCLQNLKVELIVSNHITIDHKLKSSVNQMASLEDIKLLRQQIAELRQQIAYLVQQQGQPLPSLQLASEDVQQESNTSSTSRTSTKSFKEDNTPEDNPNITFSTTNSHIEEILSNGLKSSFTSQGVATKEYMDLNNHGTSNHLDNAFIYGKQTKYDVKLEKEQDLMTVYNVNYRRENCDLSMVTIKHNRHRSTDDIVSSLKTKIKPRSYKKSIFRKIFKFDKSMVKTKLQTPLNDPKQNRLHPSNLRIRNVLAQDTKLLNAFQQQTISALSRFKTSGYETGQD